MLTSRTALARRQRFLALAAAIAAVALGSPSARAEPIGRSDLPSDAKPADLSIYLEASVEGTLVHVCRSTDVKGRFGWYLRASEATLLDAQKNQVGKSQFTYSGIPRVRVEASWQDGQGGTVVAKSAGRGPVPGKTELEWQRYAVESRTGQGPIAEAKAIVRITAWKTIPYAQRCDKSTAAAEVRSPFTATDLFFK